MSEKIRPRIGVCACVIQDGKFLLGKRVGAHGESMWAPPGGHLEFGEKVEECARRELLEETGLVATSLTLGPWVENFMEDGKKHYITIFVIIDAFEGDLKCLEPDRCEGWHWFPECDLPSPLFDPLRTARSQRSVSSLASC